MRIAFMGSGGLGGYFGARLCGSDAEVHFIARGRHLAAMRTDGLRVEGPAPLHIPRVNATDDPAELCLAFAQARYAQLMQAKAFDDEP